MMGQQAIVIVLAALAFTAAMVPMERRSLPEESIATTPSSTPPPSSTPAPTSAVASVATTTAAPSGPTTASTTAGPPPPTEICDLQTPCLWAVYIRFTRVHDYNITNHCSCKPDQKCLYFDDDISISAYVYRCQPLS